MAQDQDSNDGAPDVFRLTLTAERRKHIDTAMSEGSIGYRCKPKVLKRGDGRYTTVIFVRGDQLSKLSADLGPRHGVEIAEVCNITAQLRAIPPDVYEPA
jgi:hypothetical protein